MSKRKDLLERIALLEAEKAERENSAKANKLADEPKAEDAKADDAKVEPEKADEPKAEDAKVEPEKADEPKAEDAKADKPEGTTGSVVAGAGKHRRSKETAPEPVDDELDALSSEELEQMAKRMQAKLEAAKAKISLVRKKADEKAAAEAKAKAEAAKAKAEAEAEAKAEAEAEAKAKAEAEAAKRTFSDTGRPDRAYRYWSIKDRTWLITSDFWTAKQFGGDTWQPIWAWYIDGKIDHILSQDEADKYLP